MKAKRLPLFKKLFSFLTLTLSFIMLCLFGMAQSVTVTTDQDDYLPGEWVIITGTGWTGDTSVKLTLDKTLNGVETPAYWVDEIQPDEYGDIYDEWFVFDDELGASFTLTAFGLTSGLSAATYFTDGNAQSGSGVMTVDPVFTCNTSNLTYTFSFNGVDNKWADGSYVEVDLPWTGDVQVSTQNILSGTVGAPAKLSTASGTIVTIPISSGAGVHPVFELVVSGTGVNMPSGTTYTIPVMTALGSDDPVVPSSISTDPVVASSTTYNGIILGSINSCGSISNGVLTFYGSGDTYNWQSRLWDNDTKTWSDWSDAKGNHDEASYNLNKSDYPNTTQFRVLTTGASCGTLISADEYESEYYVVGSTAPIIVATNINSNSSFTPPFGVGENVTIYSFTSLEFVKYFIGGTDGTEIFAGHTFPGGTTTVTVQAENSCGASTATFDVTAGIAPQINCPADSTIYTSADGAGDCNGTYSKTLIFDGISATNTPTAGHYIGSPEPSITYKVNDGEENLWTGSISDLSTGQHTITLIATNGGGTADCSFTVTVMDDEAPVVQATTDGSATVECLDSATQPDTDDVPVAIDNCEGEITGTLDGSPVDNLDANGCEGTRTYTYSYTDGTNTSNWHFVYTIQRTTNPSEEGEVAKASTKECANDAVLPTTLPVVKDVCGTTLSPVDENPTPVYWVWDDTEQKYIESTSEGFCEGQITYTFDYEDCAGLEYHWVYTYNIVKTDFVKNMPDDDGMTVECSGDIAANVPTPPKVEDNCGNEITPTGPATSNIPDCEGEVTHKWTYTDCSGNFSHDWTYTFTIKRVTPPDEVDETPVTNVSQIECISAATVPTTLPEVKDVCGVTLSPADENPSPVYWVMGDTDWEKYTGDVNDFCEGKITYEFDYKDCANLEYHWVYTYNVIKTDFVKNMPDDDGMTVECSSDIAANVPTPPKVEDNCGNEITPTGPATSDIPDCEGEVTYKWTYTDCSGNFSHDWTYTFTIKRETPPSEYIAEGESAAETLTNIECEEDAVAPTLPVVKDVCGTVLDAPVPDIDKTGYDGCKGTIVYTYTYEDCAGLQFVWTFTYNVDDVTAPTIDCKSDTIVSTDEVPTPNDDHCTYTVQGDEFDVTAEDNCDKTVALTAVLTGATQLPEADDDPLTTLAGIKLNPGTTTVTWTADDGCGNTSDCSFNVSVKIPTTTVVSTSADATRWWDEITLYAVVDEQCNSGNFSGTVQFSLGGIPVGDPVKANLIPFGDEGYDPENPKLRATLIYKVTSEAIKAELCKGTTTFAVTAVFTPEDEGIYKGSDGQAPTDLTIFRRKAVPFNANTGFYTGDMIGWITSNNSNTATITLAATLKDNSKPIGDLRNATVTFCWLNNGDPEPIPGAKDLPVGLVNQLDGTVGFASADIQINISKNSESESFDIGILISGGYTGSLEEGHATITIARSLSDGSILGNGTVLNDASSGQIKGAKAEDVPTTTDSEGNIIVENLMGVTSFDFNVVYNRKATNPQGYFNMTIISWYDSQGILDSIRHTYFVKSNAINNFIVGPTDDLASGKALFEAKANIKEFVYNEATGLSSWITVDGNSPLVVTMTDAELTEDESDKDSIAITYFNANGGIWFSNNWVTSTNLPHTEKQEIYTGEITVEGGETISKEPTKGKKAAQISATPQIETSSLNVYPNPFKDRLMFEFVSPVASDARIDIYDVLGRLVKTVYDNPVEAGVYYHAEFIPNSQMSNMYFYRLTLGTHIFNGKVMYTK